ncbi:MAG: hypothetical protein RMA76_02090 [Deltaproteobacteria bacterium]|jgi:hypothetical protein
MTAAESTAPREPQTAPAEDVEAPADPPAAEGAFHCPNGCGPMLRRRCKLSCQRCGYYDSCSDFC